MRKSQFTESQIVSFIRRHEQGEPVVDVCRDAGISQGTFYQFKAKYSGMDSSQLKKLKDLEAEILRYQRLVGQQALQITVFKDVIEKKL